MKIKQFGERMVKDHTDDVSDFQKESTKAEDADLKAFVTRTLPTLQEHLKKAQEIEPKVIAQK